MKIYRVSVDVSKYQWILPEIAEEQLLDLMTFDCQPKIDSWPEIEWYVYNPKKQESNFYSLGGVGAFVFDDKVYESDLFTLLEMSGEILPINVEGKPLYVLNVLECINALNKQKTQWEIFEDGQKGRILKYDFHENRVMGSSLFKIPETSRGDILACSGVKGKGVEEEFYSLYKKLKFTGLIFEELYSS